LRALVRNESGTALVEFALILPILMALTIGILDFGRALNYYNQLSQLAGQGARAAAVNCNPDGSCPVSGQSIQVQIAENYAQGALTKKMSACIAGASGVGQPVTVTASYQFNPVGFLPFISGSTFTISASQTERQEVAPSYSTGCAS
jgi:Flp pilus assembly protein TadG